MHVMGHDTNHINVTLPANNNKLIASIKPGLMVEGSLESGPSLMAYTAEVLQAVAGSMPYCRITAWKSAWEVRKRESVRLPISVEIDFQHISTVATNNMRISNIDKELGTIRPGKLMDISLGGCCLETPSSAKFNVGDMVRFSKALVTGNPPATLLGAIVNVADIDPEENAGAIKRLHVQFLIIDDVSQRILVRTMRQLQDVMAREEWMQAQQLLQRMRRNKIENLGSPPRSAAPPG
ncbi:MAG: PilZ domain-containing protein [Planctomycetes bacterium]|nr:PilZ domain-containing protein [Planctomycetota bacterium]